MVNVYQNGRNYFLVSKCGTERPGAPSLRVLRAKVGFHELVATLRLGYECNGDFMTSLTRFSQKTGNRKNMRSGS